MILGSHVQVWFLQRRFHKDILLNPVLVLSFCPDLSSKHGQLGTATRELLFLLDGSSLAHKACGGTVWAGLGVGWGSRSEVGCSTQTRVLSFSYSHRHLTPRSRASLIHKVTFGHTECETQVSYTPPESYIQMSLTNTQSLPHTPKFSLAESFSHTVSCTQGLALITSFRPSFYSLLGEGRQAGVSSSLPVPIGPVSHCPP